MQTIASLLRVLGYAYALHFFAPDRPSRISILYDPLRRDMLNITALTQKVLYIFLKKYHAMIYFRELFNIYYDFFRIFLRRIMENIDKFYLYHFLMWIIFSVDFSEMQRLKIRSILIN